MGTGIVVSASIDLCTYVCLYVCVCVCVCVCAVFVRCEVSAAENVRSVKSYDRAFLFKL